MNRNNLKEMLIKLGSVVLSAVLYAICIKLVVQPNGFLTNQNFIVKNYGY
jgi:hypothetical protein